MSLILHESPQIQCDYCLKIAKLRLSRYLPVNGIQYEYPPEFEFNNEISSRGGDKNFCSKKCRAKWVLEN